MGFGDKFKSLFSMSEDYNDEFDMDEDEVEVESAKDVRSSGFSFNRSRGEDDDKVVDIRSSAPAASHASSKVKIVYCKLDNSLDNVPTVGTFINEKQIVLLNLESCSNETSQRIIDILSGVTFANNSEMKKIAESVFAITPYNVPFSGDLLDGIERRDF